MKPDLVNFLADALTCFAILATLVAGIQLLIERASEGEFRGRDVARLAMLVVLIGVLVWFASYTGGSLDLRP